LSIPLVVYGSVARIWVIVTANVSNWNNWLIRFAIVHFGESALLASDETPATAFWT